ncbi:DUF2802 domain-containing protein [Kaarinaea lacus]
MNEVVVETSITGILVSATIMMAVLVVLALIAMTIMYRYFNQVARQQSQIIEELQKDVNSLAVDAKQTGKRLFKSENKFNQLARRQYLYEVQQMKNRNYERAKDMINRGENVKKVVENCKITKTEAELILLANKMNKVA